MVPNGSPLHSTESCERRAVMAVTVNAVATCAAMRACVPLPCTPYPD